MRKWTDQDPAFIQLWNDRDISITEIGLTLNRSRGSLRCRAAFLRSRGIEMLDRQSHPSASLKPSLPPFTMPDGMRYEDDPRAISPRVPVFVPMPSAPNYAAASSIHTGARLIPRSGKVGAVA